MKVILAHHIMLNCSVLSSPQSHPSVTQAKAQTHKNQTNWYKTRSSKNLFKPDNFAQNDLYTAFQLRQLFEKYLILPDCRAESDFRDDDDSDDDNDDEDDGDDGDGDEGESESESESDD